MPIDASIPLQLKPSHMMTPADAISLKNLSQQSQMQGMQMQEAQRKQQTQVALRDILGKPGAIDEKGMPTDVALGEITKVDPQTAMTMTAQRQKAMNEAYAQQATRVGLTIKQNDALQEALTGHVANYNELKKKLPPEQAQAEFVKNWNDYLDETGPSGIYTPQQIQGMRNIKSPEDALKVVGGTKFYKDMMSVQNQEQSQKKSDQRIEQGERRLEQNDERIAQGDRRLNATLDRMARTGGGGSGGKPPSGYTWSTDPASGERTLTPIKGGPAAKAGGSQSKAALQLGRDFEKAKLPESIAVMEQAEKLTPELAAFVTGPQSLLPDWSVPKEAQEARQDVQKLFNITLKDRSGAAVTNQEMDRLKKEFGTGAFKSPGQLMDGIAKARRIIEKHYASVAATHGKSALDAYNENVESVGGKPFEMRGGDAPQLKQQVEGAGWSYEPDKYEYRNVNGNMQRRAKGG